MKTGIVDRVRELMEFLGMSESTFAQHVDIDKSNFSKILSGQRTIGDGVINKIVLATDCSKEWLKNGKGLMFLKPVIKKRKKLPVTERLVEFFRFKHKYPYHFSKATGYDENTLSEVLIGNLVPDTLLLEKLLTFEPRLNLYWLITGNGEMMKEENEPNVEQSSEIIYLSKRVEVLSEEKGVLKERVRILEDEKNQMKSNTGRDAGTNPYPEFKEIGQVAENEE